MSDRLNLFVGEDSKFYFKSGQVITLYGRMFQHQIRFNDSFGTDLLGHYMIDERNFEVEMKDESLSSFRIACDALLEHQGDPPS